MTARESIDPMSSMWAWLAFDLWFWRTQRGLSLAEMGQIVKAARGTVSNWEAGRLRPHEDQMCALDKAWNTGGHFERLHYYARSGHNPDWSKHSIKYEGQASEIKIYNGKAFPTLVQTPEYAQCVLVAAGRTGEVEAGVAARMKRQEILTGPQRPYVWILLDQDVLEIPVGPREVMRGQLSRLLDVTDLERVTVRIVPRSAGSHPGHDGSFQVYTIGSREVAYTGAQTGGRLIEAGDEVRNLRVRFDQIGALALPCEASKGLIRRTMERYR